jgi:hypothetical protein
MSTYTIKQNKMKQLILTLGIVLTTCSLRAQIVVKESIKDSVVWQNKLMGVPKLLCFYSSEGTSYTMYFQNAKYTQIRDIQYVSIGDLATTKEFFGILLKVADGTEEKVTIEMDKSTWLISKSMGSVMIWSSYESFYLSKKNIETILELLNQVK